MSRLFDTNIPRRGFLRAAGLVGAGGTAAVLLGSPEVASAIVPAPVPVTNSVRSAALRLEAAANPTPAVPPAPLFRDPIFDGAADPTVIYNVATAEWWMFYTNRRATVVTDDGVAWVHGTDIGIATSADGGITWIYRGIANGLDFAPGRNTYWAPEIIKVGSTYHMYVVFIVGVPNAFVGNRRILHYTSTDLWDWTFQSELTLNSSKVIDPCIWPMPTGGKYRMWYKDEANGSHIYAADSTDLNSWTLVGAVLTNMGQEGPNVFKFGGYYWMSTDSTPGLQVYRSTDLVTWTHQSSGLLMTNGTRTDGNALGSHCFLLSQGATAFIVYFCQFGEVSRIQVAPLAVSGGVLTCDRNTPFDMAWLPASTATMRGGTATT